MDDALIQDLVGSIYDGAIDPVHWRHALDLMSSLNGGGDGAIMEVRDAMLDPAGTYITSNIDPSFAESWQSTYGALCPYTPLMLRDCPPQTPVLGESLIAWPAVADSVFGREWMDPQALGGATGGIIELSPSRLAWIGLTTPLTDDIGWETRANTLRHSLPHWARAFQINRQIELANAKAGLTEAALDRMPHGVVITDAVGRVVVANRQAVALVKARDGLGFDRGGAVHAAKQATTQQLHALIRAVSLDPADRGTGGIIALERPSGLRALVVLVTALPSQTHVTGQPVKGAMLLVADPASAVLPAEATLSASFGLSPAEAKLVGLLLRDMSIGEAAEQLQLSLESQRVRLKRIFAKTGTSRQSELIGLALRLPALRG